ncbi:endonuclease/exonuclease/phosphatase family protein [Acuticoccus sp. M5D2P5]|uniref:endonuclease/exonuclease/phosphatase family protein n=1 Tax=Acuticoccus kalidii TaxID=2910977 RepID=UPI001F3FE95B|nr:endonuclease/exonuclease/phosphatase family protein [Acuticoccus kalidii]MCF3932133.1 endonuclease/exonuclease/phosphatase family protein [Acuticoccus kalidii]
MALVAVLASVPLILGFLGPAHPFFDSFAHFRAQLGAVTLIAGLMSVFAARGASRFVGGLATIVAMAALWTVSPYVTTYGSTASAQPQTYTLLQMNVFHGANLDAALDRIRTVAPDIVTLEEVTETGAARFAEVRDLYPFQRLCKASGYSPGQAILSRHPFIGAPPICRPESGFLAQRIEIDGAELTLVAQHLSWPWPHGQWEVVDALAPTLGTLDWPVMIGGDFNAAPWSASVRRYAARSGTSPVGGIGPTWMHPKLLDTIPFWVGLPIDNVLVSRGIHVVSAGTEAPTESDHLPVVVRFTIDNSFALGQSLTERARRCAANANAC